MIPTLFLVLQLTGIAGLCWLLSTMVIRRSPSFSAWLCLIGIAVSFMVLATYIIKAPKVDVSRFLLQYSFATSTNRSIDPNATASESQSSLTGLRVDWLASLDALTNKWNRVSDVQRARVESWCWGTGFVVAMLFATRLLVSIALVVKLGRSSSPFQDRELEQRLAEWGTKSGTHLRFQLRLSELIASPCVTWFQRGLIYLPKDFGDWQRNEQLASLAHEATHELRRDAIWRGLADLLVLPLCFHPLIWLLRRQLVLAQELATDRSASELMRGKAYQKGLCQLALRMDLQREPRGVSFGVSISTSNLVRRIKMLNCRIPTLTGWRRSLVLIVALLGSSFLGIWGMNADEPVRVAKKQTRGAETDVKSFARESTKPWESLGRHNGYFAVHVNDVMKKAKLSALVDSLQAQYELTTDKVGFSLAKDALCLTGNLEFVFDRSNEDTEHKHKLSLGSTNFEMTFRREIDWAPLVRETIAMTNFLPGEMGDTLRDWMKGLNKSDKLQLLSQDQKESAHLETIQSLWKIIDGGYASAVFAPQGLEILNDESPDETMEAHERAWLKVVQATRMIGIGVDTSGEPNRDLYRLVLVPNDATSVEIHADLVQTAIETSQTHLSKQVDAGGDTQDAVWHSVLAQSHVSVQQHEGIGAVIMIGGEFSDAILFPGQ
jgi:beta-lactamase regulating signal transducer with metallopeptidase domain